MKRLPIFAPLAALTIGAVWCAVRPGEAQTTLATFFPTRPVHAGVKWAKGVLTAYDRGNTFGGFNLRDDVTGRIDRFSMARRMWIGGRFVTCSDPPQPGYDHFQPGPTCPDWPRGVVIGSTHVVVTYWAMTDPQGRATFVSDTIAVRGSR